MEAQHGHPFRARFRHRRRHLPLGDRQGFCQLVRAHRDGRPAGQAPEAIQNIYDATGRGKDVWWPTTIWVEYERARGVLHKDGRPEGFNPCCTKGFKAGPAEVFARHGPPGRSRARKARQDHRCRGRVAGLGATAGGRNVLSVNPTAIQMRYLQTLAEISIEKNSTILFPLPIELMRAFERHYDKP